jgi:uncharacterized membrane protein
MDFRSLVLGLWSLERSETSKHRVKLKTKDQRPKTEHPSPKMYTAPNKYIPQLETNRRPLLMWLLVSIGSLAVIAVIVGAPLALAAGHPLIAATIYQTFSHLCHQLPERSFFIEVHPFAVCARCTGIYAGFAMATVFYPLIKSLRQTEAPPRKWLFIAAAPLAIDFLFEFSGIGHNTHSSRFLTGALLGAVAVFYIMPGLMDLSLRQWRRRGDIGPAEKTNPAAAYSTGAPASSDYSAPHRRI